jgi:energy-coupling factor transporter ATP-binding protein EcfA2
MYRRTSLAQRHFCLQSSSSPPTLDSLSLFLPANELTFLIDSSGSGKSTVAQLPLGFHSPLPGSGHITIDEQDLRFLDDSWIREKVMLIGQGIGAGGGGGGGDPAENNNAGSAASYGSCILFLKNPYSTTSLSRSLLRPFHFIEWSKGVVQRCCTSL